MNPRTRRLRRRRRRVRPDRIVRVIEKWHIGPEELAGMHVILLVKS